MRKNNYLILLVLVLTACSSIIVEPEKSRRQGSADLYRPIPGKAVVYVYRDASLLEGYYTSKLIVNGYTVSTGAMNSYNILVLPPGDYDIGVTSSFQKGDYVPTDVTFSAGKVYYLKVYWEKDSGFMLRAVIDSRAKKVISTGRLIAIKELCPSYSIDKDRRMRLGDSHVLFRSYRKGICSTPP